MTEPTVFIVDDDEASAASVGALSASLALKAKIFPSAEAFLASYDGSPGCLVLDVRLGGMSGLELQQHLVERGVRLPTIVISGHADRELSNSALVNGAIAWLEKPYDGAKFCDAVRKALGREGDH